MKAAHALGRAPVNRDGGKVLVESGAIVQYGLARHGGGQPQVAPATPNFAHHLYWLRNADARPGRARAREGTRQHLGTGNEALRVPGRTSPQPTS